MNYVLIAVLLLGGVAVGLVFLPDVVAFVEAARLTEELAELAHEHEANLVMHACHATAQACGLVAHHG